MDPNQLFSIGEAAQMNNISTKSLRHYDEIGLLKPKYVDDSTGYRYYSYSQFSYIDKIKRFKNVGISLQELKTFFEEEDLSVIEQFLAKQLEVLEQEASRLEQKRVNTQLLLDFFEDSKRIQVDSELSCSFFPERKMISVPCIRGSSIYEMDADLRQTLSMPAFAGAQILNPYGYMLDYGCLLENRIVPVSSTVCVSGVRCESLPCFQSIPAGDYLCFRAKILTGAWDIQPLIRACKEKNKQPAMVLACEYLTSFYKPSDSVYNIQVLFQ